MGSGGGVLVAAGVSHAGRARLAIRLMCSLLYLKHAFNLSDEETCERWAENVVWQYFSKRSSEANAAEQAVQPERQTASLFGSRRATRAGARLGRTLGRIDFYGLECSMEFEWDRE